MGFWQNVSDLIKNSDVIIEVIDARMPELASNKEIEKLVAKNRKNLIKVFNKIDLISGDSFKDLKKKYKEGFFVSVRKNEGVNRLRDRLKILSKKKEDFKIGFVGYPNAGKSSLINILTRRGKTKVSKKAGTTRGLQWVTAGKIKILDSPGVIPDNEWSEIKLALISAKNVNKLKNPEKVALGIIKLFLERNPESLKKRYGLENIKGKEDWEILEMIGESKGLLKKKGEVDENRAAFMVINDWQQGRLKL